MNHAWLVLRSRLTTLLPVGCPPPTLPLATSHPGLSSGHAAKEALFLILLMQKQAQQRSTAKSRRQNFNLGPPAPRPFLLHLGPFAGNFFYPNVTAPCSDPLTHPMSSPCPQLIFFQSIVPLALIEFPKVALTILLSPNGIHSLIHSFS